MVFLVGCRIAILHEGRLKCCGSPQFLKRAYDCGVGPQGVKVVHVSMISSWKPHQKVLDFLSAYHATPLTSKQHEIIISNNPIMVLMCSMCLIGQRNLGYNVTFVKRPGCDIDVVREAELNLKRENQGTRIQKQIETSATCKSEGCVPPRARAHFGRLRLVQQRQGGSREHSQHFPRPHQVNINSTYSTSTSRILSKECLCPGADFAIPLLRCAAFPQGP